jgi:hypothetical protein
MYQLLPLIDNETWNWKSKDKDVTNIPSGRSETIVDVTNKTGFVYSVLITVRGVGGEQSVGRIVLDRVKEEASYQELFEAGLIGAEQPLPALIQYDTTGNTFSTIFSPGFPIPFNDRVKVSVDAPPTNGVALSTDYLILVIEDRQRFIESYKEISYPDLESVFDALD